MNSSRSRPRSAGRTTRRSTVKAGAVVVGQVARDLVVRVERLPAPGRATTVARRIERLGGKGANHALGLHQLGLAVALVGVVGTDHAGDDVLHEADTEGLDVAGVVRRGETALLIDVTDDDGRRLLEDVPSDALLRPEDVERTASLFDEAAVVSLQLQQPTDAVLTAAHLAAEAGARIVLDGATEDDGDELLALADVVRADATEAAMWTGTTIRERADAARVTRSLLERGPSLAAVTVPGQGDLVDWRTGRVFLPYGDSPVVDPTGGGDAFLAGLVAALTHGAGPEEAGQAAARAAASTVARLGGRPELGR
ncbi:ribokinase [Curtobacterium pusillum]|uniref:Ribokinase n=1 Tax=Curtobacterium pusillum TaxID=69373 RepID=A0ABX2MFP0_9MICO|nr:PfkB family carbohydrate kinase [Curtobacterium pusillum]NUU14119.1 ribokinase [Curtobacterium pusillum]